MKKQTQKLTSLMLTLMLMISVFPLAHATEAAIGSTTEAGYTVVGYQYAYGDAGVVHLYNESGTAIVGTIGNGARLTVTDGQRNGRVYVTFNGTAGWINNSELHEQLPQTVTGEVSGSSAPANQLIPIQTTPPQQDTVSGSTEMESESVEDEPISNEEDQSSGNLMLSDEDSEEDAQRSDADDEDTDQAIDHEKDHEPIAAMYQPDEPGSEPEAVDVVQLGVIVSVIVTEDGRQEVDTALLTFGEEVPDEQKLGYVHAPRTGQAGLRQAPAKGSKVITQLKAGQLAAVLAIEEEYAHISVQGQEGYLRLDCLKYLTATSDGIISSNGQPEDAASGDDDSEAAVDAESDTDAAGQEETSSGEDVLISVNGVAVGQQTYPAQALLSCKGEIDGQTSVNLRNLPTKDSAKAAVWRTGVSVTVLSEADGWYLVEADGVCGYVMEAFLTMEE